MFKIFILIVGISLIHSKQIYIKNSTRDVLKVSVTGFEDLVLITGYDNGETIDVPTGWNGTIVGRHINCTESDCVKYATKAQFTIGYLAENIDLHSVVVIDGYNYGMTINSYPWRCSIPECVDSYFLSSCDDSAKFISNNRLYACKNTDVSIIMFNIKCGKAAVTSDSNVDKNTYQCANVESYTVVFREE